MTRIAHLAAGWALAAVLLAGCAGGATRGSSLDQSTPRFGPTVWDPALQSFVDPFNGYPVAGGMRR